jgi:hypothetical protein
MAEQNEQSRQMVVLSITGDGIGAYAAAMSEALAKAGAPGWLLGKFAIIGATGDALQVAVAVQGGDPGAIGRTALSAIGSVLGGTIGGVIGGTLGGPGGAAFGAVAGGTLGRDMFGNLWDDLTNPTPLPVTSTWEIEGLPLTVSAETQDVSPQENERLLRESPGSLMAIESLRDLFTSAEAAPVLASPIILDLDGDGVETLNVKDGAYFDHDGNGFAEQTGWAGADDGLLVWDRDGDGRIKDGTELFGNETLLNDGSKAADGFQALAELDDNADGRVDASDAAFANLRVWKDADGDGVSSAGELLSLTDLGIESIATGYSASGLVDAQGNQHREIGSFIRTDGTAGAATDVWFQTDTTFTIAREWLAVPADLAALPDLQGFGNVYDLKQAMVRDGSGALRTLVENFTAQMSVGSRNATFEQTRGGL